MPQSFTDEFLASLSESTQEEMKRFQDVIEAKDFKSFHAAARELLRDLIPWKMVESHMEQDGSDLLVRYSNALKEAVNESPPNGQKSVFGAVKRKTKEYQAFMDSFKSDIDTCQQNKDSYGLMVTIAYFVLGIVFNEYGLDLEGPDEDSEVLFKRMAENDDVPTLCAFTVFARLLDDEMLGQFKTTLSPYYQNRYIGLFSGIAGVLIGMGEEEGST